MRIVALFCEIDDFFLWNSIMAKSLTDGEMVDGKKHGYWVTYYANGHKRSEGRYIAGKKEVPWIHAHENGNKAIEPPSATAVHTLL